MQNSRYLSAATFCHRCYVQNCDLALLPQHCLGAHSEGESVCYDYCLDLLDAGLLAPSLHVQVYLAAKSHFTRCRFLHRNVLPSAWQHSALFIHVFSEQEFCVHWQWGRSFWEALRFCRAPSLWGFRGWPVQNSYKSLLLKPAVGRLFADEVETSVGSGSICECFKTFFRNKMNCSAHSFVPCQLHCFASGCS